MTFKPDLRNKEEAKFAAEVASKMEDKNRCKECGSVHIDKRFNQWIDHWIYECLECGNTWMPY